jgi:ABC-2 type transport system permease protein
MAVPQEGGLKMLTRLRSLLIKEMIQFSRDPVLIIVVLWLYTIEVVLCVFALSMDVRHIPLAVLDRDQSPSSRRLIESIQSNEFFNLVGYGHREQDPTRWLEQSRAVVVLIVPEDFGRELRQGRVPQLQILLDGTNSNTAAIARGYALQAISAFQNPPEGGAEAGAVSVPVRPILRVWYNPDQTLTCYMTLSMIALACLMVGLFLPAASIVREKEVGTLDQLAVTPIGTTELFIAKTAPPLVLGLLAVFPSLVVTWWFGVPLRGSLWLFLGLTALFLLSAIAGGVFIATISQTMQQALLISFFTLFPVSFLSGTLVPVESMPRFLQGLARLSPLRYYMDVILGIFLKGSGIAELWPQTAILLAFGAALFIAAAGIFGRRFR